jgi:two-component system chemotaxis response regulator CheB
MFSTLTQKGAVATIDALSLGASDYVTKPANVGSVTAALQKVREELIPRIKSLCPRHPQSGRREPARPAAEGVTRRPSNLAPRPVEIICIAVSTGGPNALADIFRQLPAELRVPIVIVQHMPPVFTTYLAQRLTANSPLHVFEARTGDALRPGCAWLAPGDFHLTLERHAGGVFTALNQGPPENSCRPAADMLFRSVAEVYGAGTLGVVLTGMGQDGLRGCEAIHAAGGRIIVQDEPSSVVWGMAGAVFRGGLADEVLPLDQVPARLAQLAGLRSTFQSLVTTGSSV